jgi:mRNA-degrading endonuclease RelE of RelBE toxin-antitoxin system
VTIVETSIFTRQVNHLLSAESYRQLQIALVDDPRRPPVIPRSGGLRKLRWEGSGRGRRGGIRVIYKWIPEREWLLMLLAYSKSEHDDLTREQLRILRRVVEEELR